MKEIKKSEKESLRKGASPVSGMTWKLLLVWDLMRWLLSRVLRRGLITKCSHAPYPHTHI